MTSAIEQATAASSSPRWRWDRPSLVAVVALAILLRAAVIWSEPAPFVADVDNYRALAENLVQNGVFGTGTLPTAYRPPLYSLLLACLGYIGALNAYGIGAAHLLLGGATVWLAARLGHAWGLGRWSYFAAALVAADPLLVRQSALVMTETLATALATLALVALTALTARPAGRRAVLTGVILGLTVLCRPTFLIFAVAAPCCLCRMRVRPAQRVMLIVLAIVGLAVPLAAWGARNVRAVGAPVVTTTHGGFTMLLANNAEFYRHLRLQPGEPWDATAFNDTVRAARGTLASRDEPVVDRQEYAEAAAAIRAEPLMFLRAVAYRESRLWGLMPLRVAAESNRTAAVRYATAAGYGVVFLLAGIGLGTIGRRLAQLPWLFGVSLALSFSAVHACYWTDMRMRAPLTPVLALLAAAGGAWCVARFRSAQVVEEA